MAKEPEKEPRRFGKFVVSSKTIKKCDPNQIMPHEFRFVGTYLPPENGIQFEDSPLMDYEGCCVWSLATRLKLWSLGHLLFLEEVLESRPLAWVPLGVR